MSRLVRAVTSVLLLSPVSVLSHSVEHVIVLMLENRSFDHMLGYLHQNNTKINGLNGNEYNYMNCADPTSKKVMVNPNAAYSDPDPDHSVQAITQQIYCVSTMNDTKPNHTADMSGFVTNAVVSIPGHADTVMSCFNENTLPVLSQLAREYALFDAWHASVPGQTQLNRMFAASATSYGDCTNEDILQIILGYPQKTFYQQVDEAGLSWGIYYEDISACLYHDYMREPQNWFKTLPMSSFFDHAKAGTLPNYVWLEPRYFEDWGQPASDQHPSHDVAEGEKLIKSIYDALVNSPKWNNTLFLVTYDEHGGFYDHVAPIDGIPNPDGRSCNGEFGQPSFDFTRLGVRVPTVAISPWIPPGTIIHNPAPGQGPAPNSQYEHTSIMSTFRKVFNMSTGALNARDAWSSTFDHILSLNEPRTTKPHIGHVHSLRHWGLHGEREMNTLQKSFVELASVMNNLAQDNMEIPMFPQIRKEGDGAKYVTSAMDKFLESRRVKYEAMTKEQA